MTVKARLLSAVRHGRPIAWTPEFMGFGNLLSLFLWAYTRRRSDDEVYVLVAPRFDEWLTYFPALQALAVRPEGVRFTDQRLMPWSESERARGQARTVPPHEQVVIPVVEDFVAAHLLPESAIARPLDDSRGVEQLVVNVRRGDYYSVPSIRAHYGFDVEAYLQLAVSSALASRPADRIQVVSDDIEWCATNLTWLTDFAPEVSYADRSRGAVGDFEAVARARRSVLTNSTFSYWAAYVSNVLHGDNHANIWAPAFFDRTQNGGRSWALDPRWSVVEELPDGWDA